MPRRSPSPLLRLALPGAVSLLIASGSSLTRAQPTGSPAPSTAPATAPTGPADPATTPYDNVAAGRDVDTVLHDRTQAYLHARARLEAAPDVAIPVLRARLGDPLTPAERNRVLNVLGSFQRPEDLALFAEALVAATASKEAESRGIGPSRGAEAFDVVMEPWRSLILAHGSAAAATLTALVSNRELATEVRAQLLHDLVGVLELDAVIPLVDGIGRGDPTLEGELRRALAERSRRSTSDRAALLEHLAATQPRETDPHRAALLLYTWASLAGLDDPAFRQFLLERCADPSTAFEVRAAALRLAREQEPSRETTAVLEQVARHSLDPSRRAEQAHEILGWLAAEGLPAERARAVADELQLATGDQPRLTQFGYEHATLAADGQWLDTALRDPWPDVKRSALSRISSPCAASVHAALERTVTEDDGDALPVAQAALQAAGRCGGPQSQALVQHVLADNDAQTGLRAAAVVVLVEIDAAVALETFVARLPEEHDEEVAAVMIEALRRTPAITEDARTAVCAAVARQPRLAGMARRTLTERFGTGDCP